MAWEEAVLKLVIISNALAIAYGGVRLGAHPSVLPYRWTFQPHFVLLAYGKLGGKA